MLENEAPSTQWDDTTRLPKGKCVVIAYAISFLMWLFFLYEFARIFKVFE